MNDIAEQRPSFFEGEILSASDLEQVVVYMRDQSARHMLGGHTWGIVAGLQLLEQTAPTGAIDLFLLPGYAVDGYGRGIVVVNPLRLDVTAFNGQPTGPVQVWIRYDQGDTSATRPGFQVCCNGGDGYSRVAESYAIEVGNPSLATQQSGISIGGEAVDDARTAQRVFDDAGLVVCDASVPYQDLPLADDTKSRWLIPLGEVGWQAGTPGQFVTLVDPTSPWNVIYSRRLRRYAGVVAENVYAADGLIRLRRRTTEVAGTVTQNVVDAACGAGDLTDPSHDADLENCTEGPMPTELVWVEGRMRVTHDVRILAPGRLELRDHHSTNYYPATTKGSMPTFLERQDTVTGTSNRADLAIVLGKAADATNPNRLLIQQASAPQQPLPCHDVQFTQTTMVAITDGGNVGIGTDSPDEAIEIVGSAPTFIHVRDTETPTDMYVGAGKYGGLIATTNTSDLRIRAGGTDPTDDTKTRMIVLPTGQVGIGTTTPDLNRALTVQAVGQASVLVRTDDQKHEGLLSANTSGTLLCAHTSGDDLILSSNQDEAGMVWLKSTGDVGINTSAPQHRLDIVDSPAAEIGLRTSGGTQLVVSANGGGTSIGSTSTDYLQLNTSNKPRVMIEAGGNVGIGTITPQQVLDVRGSIALGASSEYLAPGAPVNWAMIAGNVAATDAATFGPGWKAEHVGGSGIYSISYDPVLSHATGATVTITLMSPTPPSGALAVPTPIVVVTSAGFNVTMWWGSSSIDFGFGFLALVAR